MKSTNVTKSKEVAKMGYATVGYIPVRELDKVTGEPNTGNEFIAQFHACVATCAGDSLYVNLWELISELQYRGLYNYIAVIAKIHGDLDRPQSVKDFYIEKLETVLKYMK